MIAMEKIGQKLAEFDPNMPASTKDMFNLMMDTYVETFNAIQRELDEALARIRYLEGENYRITGQPSRSGGGRGGHANFKEGEGGTVSFSYEGSGGDGMGGFPCGKGRDV